MQEKMVDPCGTSGEKDIQWPQKIYGYVRLVLVDTDGLIKKTLGSIIQLPIHQFESQHGATLVAQVPDDDIICTLRLSRDTEEILVAYWYYGPSVNMYKMIPQDRIFAVSKSCFVKNIVATVSVGMDRKHHEKVYCPFSLASYESPLTATFQAKCNRMKIMLHYVTLEMKKEYICEFLAYFKALKDINKDKKDDKEKNSDEELNSS